MLEPVRLLTRVKAVAFNDELFTDSQKLRTSCPVLRSNSNLSSTGGVRSIEWFRACWGLSSEMASTGLLLMSVTVRLVMAINVLSVLVPRSSLSLMLFRSDTVRFRCTSGAGPILVGVPPVKV